MEKFFELTRTPILPRIRPAATLSIRFACFSTAKSMFIYSIMIDKDALENQKVSLGLREWARRDSFSDLFQKAGFGPARC